MAGVDDPEFREDAGAYPRMLELVACVEKELTKSHLAPAGIITLQPGLDGVLDYVGNGEDCSELIINLTGAFPVNGFPTPADDATCDTTLAYTLQVGLFRCAPVMGGSKQNPTPPTVEEQVNATREHLADMAALRRAIRCCFHGKYDYVLGAFAPYGPSGAAVGGVWSVTVGGEV